jgi:hypothetical protein
MRIAPSTAALAAPLLPPPRSLMPPGTNAPFAATIEAACAEDSAPAFARDLASTNAPFATLLAYTDVGGAFAAAAFAAGLDTPVVGGAFAAAAFAAGLDTPVVGGAFAAAACAAHVDAASVEDLTAASAKRDNKLSGENVERWLHKHNK